MSQKILKLTFDATAIVEMPLRMPNQIPEKERNNTKITPNF